jgi:tripartite-type tricarboxylate transporter receptor subunit TctC
MPHANGHTRCVILACCLALATSAAAQPYPSRPVTIIAPSSPGGPVDFTARLIVPSLSKVLGQQIVVENRPGASQKIGMQALLRSPRDGYTLSVVSAASMTINPLLEPGIGYDPLKDFTLLTSAVASFSVLVVHPSVPARSLRELAAYGKAHPGRLTYGDGGRGTRIHFTTVDLLRRLGVKAVHVPYKGDPPAFTDLLAGQIDLMMPVAGVAKPYVDGGRIIALAVDGEKRWDQLPNVPTAIESGMRELQEPLYRGWLGYVTAAGVPADIVEKLQNALLVALRSAESRNAFAAVGFQVVGSSSQEFAASVRAELERNRKLIDSGAIKVD